MDQDRERKEVLLRLKRIEGQVRGLQRMIEEGVSCDDILTQVSAATAAMKKTGVAIVQAYMEECFNKTKEAPVAKRAETMKNFQEALSRFMDWA
jgi:CsoR family transcriptional regulator, copper-sensing transcriptional repressor